MFFTGRYDVATAHVFLLTSMAEPKELWGFAIPVSGLPLLYTKLVFYKHYKQCRINP